MIEKKEKKRKNLSTENMFVRRLILISQIFLLMNLSFIIHFCCTIDEAIIVHMIAQC